jgi:DNA-binding CsgD family transcriptional regulator
MKIFFHHSNGTLEEVRRQLPSFLSPRECQVTSLLVDGLSSKSIAYILSISTHTVDSYIRSARWKFQAPNRAALVAAYIRMTPPEPPAATQPCLRKAA